MKSLLRRAFPDLLRPELLAMPKQGFVLPIRQWMRTSLRSLCTRSAEVLKDTKLLRPAGIDSVFRRFEAEPESPAWSRAFALCVLGDYVARSGAV